VVQVGVVAADDGPALVPGRAPGRPDGSGCGDGDASGHRSQSYDHENLWGPDIGRGDLPAALLAGHPSTASDLAAVTTYISKSD
jgi:hypothetical protein